MSGSTTEESLRLLALDGGGIRGLSSLQVLWHLLHEVQLEEGLPEMPLPCEYFDLIGGTSTGGIIALMLGRLRMSVDDALRKYAELSKEVFSERKLVGDGKFKASKLEGAIKKVIAGQRAASHDAEARMMDDGSCGVACKTFVCATVPNTIAAPAPTLFRTYEPRHGRLIDCKIWEAARATSAAPIFFKPIEIDTGYGVYTRYTDGGLGNNNPTDLVLQEAHKLFPDRKIACIISIGTGRPKNPRLSRPGIFQRNMPRVDVAIAVGKIVTDCEKTAENMERRFHHSPNVYFRFNVEYGMDGIELGDWEKLDEVHDITNAYLMSEKVGKAMENAAAAIRARRGVATTSQANGALAQIVTRPKPGATRKLCPPPTPFFTGRDDIVRHMQEYFTGSAERRRIFALYGLGGSGKSEISRMFVKVAQGNEPKRFSELFYVDASSEETIETDLGNIAVVEKTGDSAADTTRWMESRRGWLLILDNADDPRLDLSQFIPQTEHGNTIITSRNAQTRAYGFPSGAYREILNMAPEEAKELFLRRAGLKIEDQPYTLNAHEDEVVQTIVKELDYFALAIIQASAYIASNPTCNPEKYLGMYRERRRELLEEYKNGVQKLESYRGTVYTTWNISFENLQRHNPLAATFLRVCAFLHNESISESIFQNAAAGLLPFDSRAPHSEAVMSWVTDFLHSFMILDNGIWDERKFLAIVQDLCSYSLMSTSGGSDLSIHLLVQDWARTYHNNALIPTYTSFILGLSISYSYDSDLPRQANYAHNIRKLLPHVQEVQRHCKPLELYVAIWFARTYHDSGRYKDAEILEMVVREGMIHMFGEEHPFTLMNMQNLASTYQDQGRWTEAERLQAIVMEASKRVLGEEHPDTLTSMHNLASTYQDQGRWAEAERLQEMVVEIWKRVRGEEHPDTLMSMHNLASTYQYQCRWTEAERLQVKVMKAGQRVLGEEHPTTLTSMHNLASTYQDQGRWTEAERLQETVMEARKRVLGEEHPSTLTSMNDLALIYQNQGQWTEAERLQATVMEVSKRVLDEEHPETLTSMYNLASIYQDQGRWAEVERLQETVVEARKRVIGEEHPHTLESMEDLAFTYRTLDQLSEASRLEVEVEDIRKRLVVQRGHEVEADSSTSLAS